MNNIKIKRTSIGNTLRSIAEESTLSHPEKVSLKLIAKSHDRIQAKNTRMKTLLKSAANLAKSAEGTEITEAAMKLKAKIEQVLKVE